LSAEIKNLKDQIAILDKKVNNLLPVDEIRMILMDEIK